MLLLLSALAHAEDEPTPQAEEAPTDEAHEEPPIEDAPRTFILNTDGELESALDGFEAGIEDTGAMPAEVEAMLEEIAAELSPLPAGLMAPRLRGRFFLRPTLSYGGLDGDTTTRLGIAGGHRWFRLSDSTLALAGETRLSADVPLAGASGSAVALSTLAGPWIGPVGLRIGPILRYERADYGSAILDPALLGGGRAILSAEIGSFSPYIGGGLDAILAGDRPGSLEPVALVGLSRSKGWVNLSGQGSFQQTAQGFRWEVGLGIQITPHLPEDE